MLELPENGALHWGSSFIDPRGKNRSEMGELFKTVLTMVLDHLASASQKSVSPNVETYSGFATIPDYPIETQRSSTAFHFCFDNLATWRTLATSATSNPCRPPCLSVGP